MKCCWCGDETIHFTKEYILPKSFVKDVRRFSKNSRLLVDSPDNIVCTCVACSSSRNTKVYFPTKKNMTTIFGRFSTESINKYCDYLYRNKDSILSLLDYKVSLNLPFGNYDTLRKDFGEFIDLYDSQYF